MLSLQKNDFNFANYENQEFLMNIDQPSSQRCFKNPERKDNRKPTEKPKRIFSFFDKLSKGKELIKKSITRWFSKAYGNKQFADDI